MKKNIKKIISVMTLGFLAISSIGCSKNIEANNVVEGEVSNFEVVEYVYSEGANNYDVRVTSPKLRAVTLSQFSTEMLLALGLEDRIVATALLDNPILPEFEAAYKSIPVLEISEGHSISKEAFIATKADFVTGWDSSIRSETTGDAKELISKGIAPFMVKSYNSDATIETVYDDFELLGKIFNVEAKASEVISKMKNEVKEVTDKTGEIRDEDRVKLMVYDSGENNAMVVGSGLANNILELAGGLNVFGEEANKPYLNVSWEQVVAKNPQVILVTDYLASSTAEEKINFLKTHPALKGVDAIKNNRIYVVALADLSPGVRNPKAIKEINKFIFGV